MVVRGSAALGTASLLVAATPAPVAWNVDTAHSRVAFSVKHFFTPVEGHFEKYDVELLYDKEHPENSSVNVRIDVASINTGNERRDNHLRSPDFFDAERFPTITFRSTSVRRVGENELLVRGPLRIKDRVHEVEFPVRILGIKPIPEGMREMLGGVTEIASFEGGLRLIRGDFGVGVGNWAANVVVGDEVDVSILVEANRK